ncbi:hypothetical protein [Streptomyces sp. STCH 565 A]|uniref:hypothetical protein n=1 Tax=Streptomyces sp. STCH 565 A TaxID=2950532 RepID=UPI0020762395|nr:hypothetical protein [Streptomyces sp. STCH 565 A]MCM8550043.1 hypothetical protein [Streptomyces sp. STCH 565 A]
MTPAPRAVIAAALEDWWTTTDPVEPFAPTTLAADVELHLISSGYRITPDDRTTMPRHSSSCDASTRTEFGALGPCVLRHDHGGPVHRDAAGATWVRTTDWYPSRLSVAYGIVLTLALLAAATVAGIRGHGWWALVGIAAAAITSKEVADELAERRHYRRGRRR